MIQIVDREVGVKWLATEGGVETTTECICTRDDDILGWFTRADLDEAASIGLKVAGDISLRSCERTEIATEDTTHIVIRCGDFALVLDQGRELEMAYGGSDATEGLFDQPGRALHVEDLAGWQAGGPIPPPDPVCVIRGCLYAGCGFWVRLPPRPSPCPNRQLARHEFV